VASEIEPAQEAAEPAPAEAEPQPQATAAFAESGPDLQPAATPEGVTTPSVWASPQGTGAEQATADGTELTQDLQSHDGVTEPALPQTGPPLVAVLPTLPGYPAYPGQPDYEFQTMPITAPTKPRRPPRPKVPCDPAAAAIGNGSLLGIGYALMGRWGLAVLAALVTVGFAVLLATTVQTLWFELVVVGWWVLVIAHGWLLAKRQTTPPDTAKRQRLVALAVTVPVLLVLGAVRFDAARVDMAVADAKQAGDCADARQALDRRWVGQRIIDAPLYVEGDDTIRACDLLQQANTNLTTALTGDAAALRGGVDRLRTVLHDLPGHENMAGTVLDRFLKKLPTDDACDTATITSWLGSIKPDRTVLDRAKKTVPRVEPKALVLCGDQMMTANNWTAARERYQQLIDKYPGDDLAPRAKEGVTRATQAIELANVRQLLATSTGTVPDYCTKPAPYSAAPAYGAVRPNRALFYGADDYTNRLPAEWKATDAADAVLIICADESQFGAPVETCPYESPLSPFGYTDVTFKRILVPAHVFELKTGREVSNTVVDIGGASCPPVLQYYAPGSVDLGPPSETYVAPADGDISGAFAPIIGP
jgi:hypothetical protein